MFTNKQFLYRFCYVNYVYVFHTILYQTVSIYLDRLLVWRNCLVGFSPPCEKGVIFLRNLSNDISCVTIDQHFFRHDFSPRSVPPPTYCSIALGGDVMVTEGCWRKILFYRDTCSSNWQPNWQESSYRLLSVIVKHVCAKSGAVHTCTTMCAGLLALTQIAVQTSIGECGTVCGAVWQEVVLGVGRAILSRGRMDGGQKGVELAAAVNTLPKPQLPIPSPTWAAWIGTS